MFNLLEDNKSIEDAINYLNKLIVELRTIKGLDEETKQILLKNYNIFINPWTKEYYLNNKEISKEEEEEMMDVIISNIGMISSLLKHK